MERIDDLQIKGLRLIQDTDLFMFGTDSVLLSDFARPKKNTRILDIGTGTGVICFLLYGRCEDAKYVGIDIQQKSINLACRSKEMNGTSAIDFICTDLKDYTDKSGFDLVCSNPPYERLGTGFTGGNEQVRLSRYETAADIDDLIACASLNVKPKGRVCMVYKAERLGELIKVMGKYRLELKRLRPIQKNAVSAPRLILVEAIKDGNMGVKWQEPLLLYDMDGNESEELRRIYGNGR